MEAVKDITVRKKYVVISSNGLIQEPDLRMLGATTKEGNSKMIGYFGSGIKFSLAYLVRNNIDVRIFSGNKEIEVGSKDYTYRGDKIKLLTINGVETSITTRFGADWEAWFVLREFISNAIDEGGYRIELGEVAEKHDDTRSYVYIEFVESIANVYNNLDRYFAMGRHPVDTVVIERYGHTNRVRIYRNIDGELNKVTRPATTYRKGIRCSEDTKMVSHIDFDFDAVDINESRIEKSSWTTQCEAMAAMSITNNRGLIRDFLLACGIDRRYEKLVADRMSYVGSFSDAWGDVLKELVVFPDTMRDLVETLGGQSDRAASAVFVPRQMFIQLSSQFGNLMGAKCNDVDEYIEVEPNEDQRDVLIEAVELATKIGYRPTAVKVVVFADTRILATYDEDKTVLVSARLLDMGVLETTSGIVEEVTHMQTGFADETRALQTHLFTLLTRLLLKNIGKIF